MKLKFDGWSSNAWYPAGPDLEKEEDFPGWKKSWGGRAFSECGRIYVSKGTKWRDALYWHERGHCLLFEAGKHKRLLSSMWEEMAADAVAELMTSTRQVLGMLVMLLNRSRRRYVHEIVRRINAVVDRNPGKCLGILEKMPSSTRLAAIVQPLKEKCYGKAL